MTLQSEYEKIVDLFTSEDRTAWELISIYFATQIALVSAFVIASKGSGALAVFVGYWYIFLIGIVSSLMWFFIQWRSNMWRNNWLAAGFELARQLRFEGFERFEIFELERHVRRENETLDLRPDERGRFRATWRPQRLWERIGALRMAHWSMLIIAILWIIALIILGIQALIELCVVHV